MEPYVRERLVRTGKDSYQYDEKWGYFEPSQRLKVDQSPLPFSYECKKTYGAPEKDKVWISQSNANSRKRFCTLNICFRPEGDQPRVSIIFRGKGKRISSTEKESWDKDVDVYFQPNAWADTPFCVEWAKKTLKSAIEEEDHFVLFCDKLQGQIADGFKDAVEVLDGLVWYGVANATDIWQPIDAGYAQLLKMSIKQEFFKGLDDNDNIDRWYGESIFTASEKRILITNWVRKAYRMICSSKYDTLRYRLFQKTGTLITADGSGDELIQPEGLPDYKVPTPSVLDTVPARPISLTSIEK